MKIKYNNNLESKHNKESAMPSLASHKEIKAKTSIIKKIDLHNITDLK